MSQQIGGYQLLDTLGRGGQATVHLARRLSDSREVAVKIAPAGGEDRSHRLIREFRALGRLEHPNLVRVLEHGREEGRLYFVMEYVPGRDLRELIDDRRGEPPDEAWIDQVVDYALEVCLVLDYIHQQGIVHRDVKPANLRVQPEGRLKLLDFGLVTAGEEDTQLTQVGALVGSAPYIPPEQVLDHPVDPRSDLYSLGATLYHLLAGHPPFMKDTPVSTAFAVLSDEAPPLQELVPAVPDWLTEIVHRLLAKRPLDRFQSALELQAALERSPVLATSPSGLRLEVGLVGRAEELAFLEEDLARLRGGGHGLLLLTGEPGIGKTRLLDELRDRARLAGVRTVATGCPEGSEEPFGSVRVLLEDLLGSGPVDADRLRDLTEEARDTLVRSFPELAPSLGDPIQEEPPSPALLEQRRGRLPEYLAQAFLSAVDSPVLLVLDDLHRCGPATAEAFSRLLDILPGSEAPLLLALAARPGEILPGHPLDSLCTRLPGCPGARLIELGPLPEDQISALIAETLGARPYPSGLPILMDRRAGGNPLLVIELTRMLGQAEMEAIEAWVPGGKPPVELTLPDGMEELSRRWTAGLSPSALELLELLAVAGFEAPYMLLRRASPLPQDGLLDHLAELLSSGLLQERFPHGQPVYAFTHQVLREHLLQSLDPDRRRALHGVLADVMEELGGPDERWPPAAMAVHCSGAGRFERSAELRLEAGQQIQGIGRHHEAAELLEAARGDLSRLEPAPPGHQAKIHLALAKSRDRLGDLQAARDAVEIARDVALQAGLEQTADRALNRLSTLIWRQGHSSEARRIAEQTLENFRRREDDRAFVRCANNIMVSLALEGRLQEAMELMAETLERARRSGEPANLASVLNNRGILLMQMGRDQEGRKAFDQALEQARKVGPSQVLAKCTAITGRVAQEAGDWDLAAARLAEAQETFQQIGDQVGAARNMLKRALCQLELRSWGEALRGLRRGIELLRRMKADVPLAQGLCDLAIGLTMVGQYEDAAACLAESMEQFADLPLKTIKARVLVGRAVVDLRRGRPEEVRQALDQVEELSLEGTVRDDIQALRIWMAVLEEPPADAARRILSSRAVLQKADLAPLVRSLQWIGGSILLAQGQVEEALEWIDSDKTPVRAALLFGTLAVRRRALAELGRTEETRRITAQSLETVRHVAKGLDPEDRRTFHFLPEVRSLLG